MAENSKIEWCDASWTPIRARRIATGKVGWHCERHSPGCDHCYAEVFNGRLLPNGGTGLPFTRSARDEVEIFVDDGVLQQPLRWKKPRRVFVCSMTDLFAAFVPDEIIDRVFAVMAVCPSHTFQVLTKRGERMERYFSERTLGDVIAHLRSAYTNSLDQSEATRVFVDRYATAHFLTERGEYPNVYFPKLPEAWPLPNVWLGVIVEDRKRKVRIDHLRNCQAAKRFLSLEPLLEDLGELDLTGIDWAIVGGESGPGARPMHPDWARSIRDQCQAAGVPFFFKQYGAWMPLRDTPGESDPRDFQGLAHDAEGFANGGRIAALKHNGIRRLLKNVGKHDAGRLLDGREWNEMPQPIGATP